MLSLSVIFPKWRGNPTPIRKALEFQANSSPKQKKIQNKIDHPVATELVANMFLRDTDLSENFGHCPSTQNVSLQYSTKPFKFQKVWEYIDKIPWNYKPARISRRQLIQNFGDDGLKMIDFVNTV